MDIRAFYDARDAVNDLLAEHSDMLGDPEAFDNLADLLEQEGPETDLELRSSQSCASEPSTCA